MKSKLPFFVVFVLVIAGIAVFGYFRALSEPEQEVGDYPKIEITPKFFNFGEVEYGEILKHSFIVKNSGLDILKIKRVATSCACTKGKIDKEEISPGETAELLVSYDTGAMSGPHGKGRQERIIFIQSNDPKNPQVEVEIQAYVK